MANTVNAFLERLTGAAGEYNRAKVGTVQAIQSVYLDARPEVARKGQVIRVYFPDVQAFTDQAANDWFPDDINPNYVDIPFGQRPGKAIIVRDFEQFQTSTDIIEQFIDPNYKRAMEYANGQIFGLLNTTNFPTYGVMQTPQNAILDINSAKTAWNVLKRNKVPIAGPADASILYHTDIHANTLTDPSWYQESLVSATIARGIREGAGVALTSAYGNPTSGADGNTAFQFARRDDQQAPTGLFALTGGTVTVANGSTAVVGSGTSFLTQVAPAPATGVLYGQWLTFSSAATSGYDAISYPVASVQTTPT